jgi:hypothetical protein
MHIEIEQIEQRGFTILNRSAAIFLQRSTPKEKSAVLLHIIAGAGYTGCS